MTKPKSTKRSTRPFSSLPDAAYEGIEKSLTSTDGRKIAWHEYGPEDGFPVFYCHGTPGSAIEAAVFAPAARRHGCRIIAINRPGLGDSDFKPDRTVADWATDLEQVADSLGYQEFSVYGWSGGGPHALLSGAQLRERTRAIGLISPQGRYDPTKGASDKFLSRIWMPALKVLSDRPKLGRKVLGVAFKLSDHHRGRRADTSMYDNIFGRSLQHSQKQDSRGAIHDNDALLDDWGMSLKEIADELAKTDPPLPVTIWQGGKDIYVKEAATKELADALPTSMIIQDPQATHLEELLDHTDNVMKMMKRTREEALEGTDDSVEDDYSPDPDTLETNDPGTAAQPDRAPDNDAPTTDSSHY